MQRPAGESATVTTLDDKIIPYITDICKRDPKSGNVVTGGIVSCRDSSWLLSWTTSTVERESVSRIGGQRWRFASGYMVLFHR
ncbi:MAG: oleate hydratase [Ruminococcus sp.]